MEPTAGLNVPQPSTEPTENPLLKRIQMPGETFALPSGGIFYTHGELDESVQNSEVHVHPMTSLDEITIKTPDLLFSGDAVRQVFARCIPQIRKPDMLLAKDVDFLLICLRKVSYGDQLRLEHRHNCENAKAHTYDIDITQFIRTAKKIDPTTVIQNFTVAMPNGQKVLLQPIRFNEFVRVMQMTSKENTDLSLEELRDKAAESFGGIIVRVDEIEDPALVLQWLKKVPAGFITKINEHVDQTLEWGPEFGTKTKCYDCGKEIDIIAPMNPLAFFI